MSRRKPRTTSSAIQRAACFARATCSSCVPRSSGRKSAFPPNAITASLRFASDLIALERHRHAARPAAGARQLMTLNLNRVLLPGPELELRAAEEQVVLVDDVVAMRRELLGRAHVAFVQHHDSGSERERVRA